MNTSTDPALLTAAELVALFRSKQLSPVEVVNAILARIERFNPIINAYCHLDAEGALISAREAEARWMAGAPKGLVDGVPLGVKDNIAVSGMPSRFGSRLTANTPQNFDSPAVARMREHGAIVLGKTAMPEFGWKATSDSPLTGFTRNPWDTRMTTGGSSAGAAASALLGMGPLQLGTDGGGSIRIPAGFTGVYGIKPTRARVPAYPASTLGTLAHHGPLTRTVTDAALAMKVLSGPDLRDVYAWLSPAPEFRAGLEEGVLDLRVAYSPKLGLVPHIDPQVEKLVGAAAKLFESMGASVEEVDPKFDTEAIAAWNAMWWPGMKHQLAPFADRAKSLADPGLLEGIANAGPISASDLISAQLKRAEMHNAFVRFHEQFDILLTPTLPIAAFEVGRLMPPAGDWGDAWTNWAPFSYPFNLTQQPAASVPCGQTAEGLPVGLQIVGPIGADDRVLRASRAYETARPFEMLDAPRKVHKNA